MIGGYFTHQVACLVLPQLLSTSLYYFSQRHRYFINNFPLLFAMLLEIWYAVPITNEDIDSNFYIQSPNSVYKLCRHVMHFIIPSIFHIIMLFTYVIIPQYVIITLNINNLTYDNGNSRIIALLQALCCWVCSLLFP